MDKNRNKQHRIGYMRIAIVLAAYMFLFLHGCSSGRSEKPLEETAEGKVRAFRKGAEKNAWEVAADPKGKKVEGAGRTREHTLVEAMWMYYEDEEVPFVDEETFELIRKTCQEIGYSTECRKGDSEIYEEYLQKFRQFVQNEVPFLDKRTGREIYISDWKEKGFSVMRRPVYCSYYFFDVNGDDRPELCMNSDKTAVFAYDACTDRIILWTETRRGQGIAGTLTGVGYERYSNSEICEFFRLNPHGSVEAEILFWTEHADLYRYDINMVMFPVHAARGERWEITEEMKQQGVYEESSGQWFFRITDEQFEELRQSYVEAVESAKEKMGEEVRSYEELFGEDI